MTRVSVYLLAAGFFCVAAAANALTYVVTNPSANVTPGTLRWAVEEANATLGVDDIIEFNLPGGGPATVYLNGNITTYGEVTIDGSSQPGYAGTPIITLKHIGLVKTSMLSISSADSHINDLIFADGNTGACVRIWGSDVTLENCWIGTDPTFTPTVGFTGIEIGYDEDSTNLNVTIEKCVIANQLTGIRATGVTNLKILGCAIGTDFSEAQILPCAGRGVEIVNCEGAYIGPELGTGPNIIANCGSDGIGLVASNDTVMLNNSIYDVGGSAIDHMMNHSSPEINNPKDSGLLLGSQQNSPDINFVKRSGGILYIEGDINSTPATSIIIQFFASPKSGLGTGAQAKFLVGDMVVNTDAVTGDKEFALIVADTLPPDYEMYYTATATRADQSWGTSPLGGNVLASFTEVSEESDPGLNPNWIASGIDSGPEYALDPTSPDDVDIESNPDELRVIVRPSVGRYRIAGWTNPSLMTMPHSGQNIIRAKFYIYTTTPDIAPLNEVPNFRLRLENEGAVLASTSYQFANTGRSAVPHEPFYGTLNNASLENRVGKSLRPTDDPANPSLYRIDFLQNVTAANAGTDIGATFESFSTEDPADGALALTELQLVSYALPIPTASPIVFTNNPNLLAIFATPATTHTVANFGAFNAEADFQPGRRQALDVIPEVLPANLATMTEVPGNGYMLDTAGVPADKFGVGLLTIGTDNNVDAPRVEAGKDYIGLFVASSDLPTEALTPGEVVQSGMSFQIQTGGGVVTSRLELAGPAGLLRAPGSDGRNILNARLPSRDSQGLFSTDLPLPVGENGGIFFVMMPTPLDPDIRPDTPGDLGPFEDEPGPGIDLESYRDITLGVNIISQPSTLRMTPSLVIPWAQPNRARIRLNAAILLEVAPIDDGGYLF